MARNITDEKKGMSGVSITTKVAFLKQASSYPGNPEKIEAIETHMSWVFLAGSFAYKLKKPVKYEFLDFTILESRFRNAREEIRLNRRLAPDIYIGLVPLTADAGGRLSLDKKGTIVDWLVKMKRLPEYLMLDYSIRNHTINTEELGRAASLLATFYKQSTGLTIPGGQYLQRLRGEIQSTWRSLKDPEYPLPQKSLDIITGTLLHFLSEHDGLFEQRIKEGRFIEAHGDLRPEHICLGPSPAVIDCLEFNRELRMMDIAEELAFLAMECELLGNEEAGKTFFDIYGSITGDRPAPALIIFYKMRKALLRIYLVIRHIKEPKYKADPKWPAKAKTYLQLAEKYNEALMNIG